MFEGNQRIHIHRNRQRYLLVFHGFVNTFEARTNSKGRREQFKFPKFRRIDGTKESSNTSKHRRDKRPRTKKKEVSGMLQYLNARNCPMLIYYILHRTVSYNRQFLILVIISVMIHIEDMKFAVD